MNRRLVLCVVAVLVVLPLALFADASGSLVTLLADLPGWTGEQPDGADVSYSGARSLMAFRHYESGDKSFDASILVGLQAQGAWDAGYQEGFKMETPDGLMEVKTIDGFLVSYTYDKSGASGGLIVFIQGSQTASGLAGLFAMEFQGMQLDEALKTAQKFNWKKIKDQVAKIK
jgi:hypothetical protein